MVFRFQGLPPKIHDSALNRVTEEALNSPFNSVTINNPDHSIYVLKIKLNCNSCNQKLRMNLEEKGLEIVRMDVDKDFVEVKGAVDMSAIISYMKDKLKKDVEVFSPPKAVIPTDRDNGTAYKKEKDESIPRKKDRNVESETTNKKDNGTAYKKEKDESICRKKDRNVNRKCRCTVTVDEKFKGTTAVHVKNKGTKEIDEKLKRSTTMNDLYKDKDNDKDYAVNVEKDKGGNRDTEHKTFGSVQIDRGEGGDGKSDDDGGAMRKENAKTCNGYDEGKVTENIPYNDYYCSGKSWFDQILEFDQIFSNENPLTKNIPYNDYYCSGKSLVDQIFSDENPGSCCTM